MHVILTRLPSVPALLWPSCPFLSPIVHRPRGGVDGHAPIVDSDNGEYSIDSEGRDVIETKRHVCRRY